MLHLCRHLLHAVDHRGVIPPAERQAVINSSIIAGHYENFVDRDSAYEMLKARAEQTAQQLQEQAAPQKQEASPLMDAAGDMLGAFAKSAARSLGTTVGRQILRGVMGSIFGGSGSRRR